MSDANLTPKQVTDKLLTEGRAKPIFGFEDYIITLGNDVYSKKSKKFLKKTEKDGEFYVNIRKDGKTHKLWILKLIKDNFTKSKSVKLEKRLHRITPLRKELPRDKKFVVQCGKAKSFRYEGGRKMPVEGSEYKVLCKNCLHFMVLDDVENLTCPECGNS